MDFFQTMKTDKDSVDLFFSQNIKHITKSVR